MTSSYILSLVRVRVIYQVRKSILKSELHINNSLKITEDTFDSSLMFRYKIISVAINYKHSEDEI